MSAMSENFPRSEAARDAHGLPCPQEPRNYRFAAQADCPISIGSLGINQKLWEWFTGALARNCFVRAVATANSGTWFAAQGSA
jgi:hypothetical protein